MMRSHVIVLPADSASLSAQMTGLGISSRTLQQWAAMAQHQAKQLFGAHTIVLLDEAIKYVSSDD